MLKRFSLVLIAAFCIASTGIPAERASAQGVEDLSNILQIVQQVVAQVTPVVQQVISSVTPLVSQVISSVTPLVSQAISSVTNLCQQLVTSLMPVITLAFQEFAIVINNFTANTGGGGGTSSGGGLYASPANVGPTPFTSGSGK